MSRKFNVVTLLLVLKLSTLVRSEICAKTNQYCYLRCYLCRAAAVINLPDGNAIYAHGYVAWNDLGLLGCNVIQTMDINTYNALPYGLAAYMVYNTGKSVSTQLRGGTVMPAAGCVSDAYVRTTYCDALAMELAHVQDNAKFKEESDYCKDTTPWHASATLTGHYVGSLTEDGTLWFRGRQIFNIFSLLNLTEGRANTTIAREISNMHLINDNKLNNSYTSIMKISENSDMRIIENLEGQIKRNLSSLETSLRIEIRNLTTIIGQILKDKVATSTNTSSISKGWHEEHVERIVILSIVVTIIVCILITVLGSLTFRKIAKYRAEHELGLREFSEHFKCCYH